MSSRHSRNTIRGLENNEGNWVEDDERFVAIISEYFHSIFTSANPSNSDMEVLLGPITDILAARIETDWRRLSWLPRYLRR